MRIDATKQLKKRNNRPRSSFSFWLKSGQLVNRIARKILKERQEFVKKYLPIPADMKKLREFTVSSLVGANYKDFSWNNFKYIENCAQARLTQYNKRRGGEIDGLKYVFYRPFL